MSLLWSFVNERHERRIKELIGERAPRLFTAYSHEVAPVLGEYERTATTAITAYVGPKVVGYLEAARVAAARRGPRAAAAGDAGERRPDLGARRRAAPDRHARLRADRRHPRLPAPRPALRRAERDLHRRRRHVVRRRADPARRGAARGRAGRRPVQPADAEGARPLDRRGRRHHRVARRGRPAARRPAERRVAPGPGVLRRAAAPSRPSPTPTSCSATSTPDYFLGGRMRLDRELALRALAALGARLGMEAEEVAVGVFRIINSQMADLIRKSTIEQGHDPRDCVLVAYGGAGPTHAVFYGHEIGSKAILVLADSTVFSAEGMLTCDITHTAEVSRAVGHAVRRRAPRRLTSASRRSSSACIGPVRARGRERRRGLARAHARRPLPPAGPHASRSRSTPARSTPPPASGARALRRALRPGLRRRRAAARRRQRGRAAPRRRHAPDRAGRVPGARARPAPTPSAALQGRARRAYFEPAGFIATRGLRRRRARAGNAIDGPGDHRADGRQRRRPARASAREVDRLPDDPPRARRRPAALTSRRGA